MTGPQTQPPTERKTTVLSIGIGRKERETNRSPPSSDQVEINWNFASFPPVRRQRQNLHLSFASVLTSNNSHYVCVPSVISVNLMFIGPCIIVIVEE